MTFLSSKTLPRRTVLRGLGATMALPFLDAMLPAFSLRGAAAKPIHRFQAFYVPNGIRVRDEEPLSGAVERHAAGSFAHRELGGHFAGGEIDDVELG